MQEEFSELGAQAPSGDSVVEDSHTTARRRKKRASRGRGLRTKNGCVVCRARHMKCDEERPVCGGCRKSGRACTYGDNSQQLAVEQHARPRSDDIKSGVGPPESPTASMNRLGKKRSRTEDDSQHQGPTELAQTGLTINQKHQHFRHTPTVSQENSPYTTSPKSDSSGSPYNVSNANSRWFGLLASDVVSANYNYAPPNVTSQRQSQSRDPSASPKVVSSATTVDTSHNPRTFASEPSPIAMRNVPRSLNSANVSEVEFHLMIHYIDHVSSWLDLNDPRRHFSLWVPHLAARHECVKKAIMALSARDLTTKMKHQSHMGFQPGRNVAVEYYQETLQHLQQAMKDPDFLRSDELLATILIVSTYELIDGAGQAWERHLQGAFGVQRTLEMDGECGGFKQAVWWAWLRQDLWAAYREKRKLFSMFQPTLPYSALDEWGLAERSVYLCTQCCNFASQEEIQAGYMNQPLRSQKAEELEAQLNEWKHHLSPHYTPLPSPGTTVVGPFKPIWIHPPAFAAATQLYHLSQILLQTTRPPIGGLREVVMRERILHEAIETICGIATTMYDEAASIMSSGCLFVAGLHIKSLERRKAVIQMLGTHKSRTGFPLQDFRDELHAHWDKNDPK